MKLVGAARKLGGRIRRLPGKWRKPVDDSIPRSMLAQYLPEDPVIVEAGAAEGSDAALTARFWPKGTIYAFEPVPAAFELLVAATAGLDNVRCIELGLFDRVGELPMYISDNGYVSSSVLKPTGHLDFHPSVKFPSTIMLPMTTLDQWVSTHGVSSVDFLWLDMQGAELAALKSAEHVLTTVCAIYTEVSLRPMYEGSPLYPEVRGWLEKRGFHVVKEMLPYRDMGNVLFVHAGNLAKRLKRPVAL